eukprot:235989-Amphidinium_carterae.2
MGTTWSSFTIQEAQNVERELAAIQDTLKGLGPMLRQRGQTVFSPEAHQLQFKALHALQHTAHVFRVCVD